MEEIPIMSPPGKLELLQPDKNQPSNKQQLETTDFNEDIRLCTPNHETQIKTNLINENNNINGILLRVDDPMVLEVLWADRRVIDPLGDGSLPPQLAPEAEDDLHEKVQWIDRDVEALRDMVVVETGLKSRLDKAFLLSFLRARKFDYDKAMIMIRGYYKARQENVELYVNLVPSLLDPVWDLQMQTVLPTPDKLGRTVLIFKTGAWIPELCSLDDIFRAQVILLEHVVRHPVTQLRGISAVVDCTGLSLSQAYYLTPTYIKRMISVIQEVFPLRFKALHFINEPVIFDWVFSFIKPFLSDTIKGRLHFHGENMSGLHEHISIDSLPEEYGGSNGPFDNSWFVSILKDHEEYFSDHFNYGYEIQEEAEVATQGVVLDAVSGVGNFFGYYYRRICID